MAIPKKGSRKIVVDGIEYRWYIRRNIKEHGSLTAAIELVSNEAASILYVDFQIASTRLVDCVAQRRSKALHYPERRCKPYPRCISSRMDTLAPRLAVYL
jgi:hypothetical protein